MERISVANDQGDYLAICSNYKFLDSNQEYNSYLYSDDIFIPIQNNKAKEIIKFTAFLNMINGFLKITSQSSPVIGLLRIFIPFRFSAY